MSEERTAVMRAFGVELVLTPPELGTKGALDEARRLEREEGWCFVGQHFNPANPAAHERTAEEIWADFGDGLDVLVATTGTGGTISGVGRRLKSHHPRRMSPVLPASAQAASDAMRSKRATSMVLSQREAVPSSPHFCGTRQFFRCSIESTITWTTYGIRCRCRNRNRRSDAIRA
jgi:cysteine synthase